MVMNDNTKYIILMHLHWIEKGFTKEDVKKIHNLVTTEDPFQNVTMNKMQKEMRGQIKYKDPLLTSDFEKITFLYLNYSEHLLDLSFLKYCVNLEEIKFGRQKLKNLKAIENLENIRFIDASSNEIENIDVLYAFTNLKKIDLEYNLILSLMPIAHLSKLKEIIIDKIDDEKWVFQIL
jgi:Leucine-rich repeat (LRR) protein